MVITVVLTVIILAFVVSGYWLNSDFRVERQGLLQISSFPTGANVDIDGDSSWLQRTNTSKVLPSGEHTIKLSKEGYDSWSKTIKISEGLLYRISYPRLFLQNRSTENMLDATGTTIATISPDGNSLLLANNTTKWYLIDLNDSEVKTTELDVSEVFSNIGLDDTGKKALFTGEILKVNWDYNCTHALFAVRSDEAVEWVLLDIKNPQKSVNINREFGSNFSKIEILDNDSHNLLAVKDGNLHKIDVSGQSISAVLVANIIDFDHYGDNEVVFSAHSSDIEPNEAPELYDIGILKVNDDPTTVFEHVTTSPKVAISKFYDEKYLTILEGHTLSLYKMKTFELVANFELDFAPETIRVGYEGEFIIASAGSKVATLDMEQINIREWSTEGEDFGWIDNSMIYTVSNNKLIVYDFDGLNERTIASNASSQFPATITNNKWLYYFNGNSLVRETISD